MKADFSGWATVPNIKCSDGKTIMPDAFAHQDKQQVPLVWQHGHTDPENVLGHAILEPRDGGVYTYCFFNDTAKAQHAKSLVSHKDITNLSIWANNLSMQAGRVLHGAIREVSLVLSGANPGAVIENVSIRHSDGEIEELDDEAVIYTGLEIEHDDSEDETGNEDLESETGTDDGDDITIKALFDSLTEEQKAALHTLVGENADSGSEDLSKETKELAVQHATDLGSDPTIADIYNSMNEEQQTVLHYMIAQAIESASAGTMNHSEKGTDEMTHQNIFEKKDGKEGESIISHDDLNAIVADASRVGSLKAAVEEFALSHGIDDIDLLFPDAQNINTPPEFLKRRTEWVSTVLDGVKKSPFTRVKTMWADLTYSQARAKGYVKGTMKKEEFFRVARRVTQPTTIYKKQKLDRDDMIDITDFDVVTWLKGEMRIMLDEEIARAILVGDGRDPSDEDKIDEDAIRPIATDDELYTTVVNVNIDDASSSIVEVIDAIVLNRSALRGSGMPIMFTTETYIAQMMLIKDTTGRDIYRTLDEIAAKLRVSAIVAVEVLEEYDDIVAVLVNLSDYTLGADKGGQVSMFDDFDIDYNQYKYLIETRCSGALTKLKSAMVINKVASNVTLLTPNEPTFNAITGVITIPTQTGVTYKDGDDNTLSSGAQSALDPGESFTVYAYPSSSSYKFNTSDDDTWTFTRND